MNGPIGQLKAWSHKAWSHTLDYEPKMIMALLRPVDRGLLISMLARVLNKMLERHGVKPTF